MADERHRRRRRAGSGAAARYGTGKGGVRRPAGPSRRARRSVPVGATQQTGQALALARGEVAVRVALAATDLLVERARVMAAELAQLRALDALLDAAVGLHLRHAVREGSGSGLAVAPRSAWTACVRRVSSPAL